MGKGQATGRWLLAGLLAFSLFGSFGVSYAEPAVGDAGSADMAAEDESVGEGSTALKVADAADVAGVAGVDALDAVEVPELPAAESSDASDASDGSDALDAANAVTPATEESETGAMPRSSALPTSMSLLSSQSYAQPGPDDFEFSRGVISQLKASYVAGLTDEQKRDVRLIIPAVIDGQPVTGIANNAFYVYNSANKGLTFTVLDLSQAMCLESIGSNAFNYASSLTGNGLTGDLVIPDTVTALGESAFANCGFTGSLHLPQNAAFTTVPGQAFLNTKFSGTLTIPANVKTIDRKAFEGTAFTGEVVIPEGVEELWASAFASCASITSVTIPSTLEFKKKSGDSGHQFRSCTSLRNVTFAPNSSATALFSEMFGGCSSLNVLELPDSITNIDAKAFYNCGLKTVYLPASATITANASSFLYNCPGAVAVCKDKASYESYKAQFSSAQQAYLSYPITVSFNAGSYGANPADILRLFDRPLNMVKDEETHIWAVDETYALPVPEGVENPPEGSWFAWSFDASGSNPATETTKTGTGGDIVLYGQGMKIADPAVSFDFPSHVGKVYDGEDLELTVTAEHPLAVDPSNVQAGDYVFAYRWMLYDSSKSTATIKQQGFDNTFRLRDVADSQTGPTTWYLTYVYFYHVTDPSNVSDIFSTSNKVASYSYYVQIKPAVPSAHPTIAAGASNPDGFPALTVSADDTPGTVAWDAGQTLEEGTRAYAWTFTPDPPAAGKPANYTTAAGTLDLRVVNGQVVQRVSFDTAGGSALEPIDAPYAAPLPARSVPTREGYVFLGWYRDAAYTQPWGNADPVFEDMTLYARWQQRAATVDPGEGGVEVNGEPVDQGSHTIDIVHAPEIAPEYQEALKNVELPVGSAPAAFFELKLVVDGTEMEQAEFDHEFTVTVAHPVQEGVRYRIIHMKHDGTTELLDALSDMEAQTLTFSVTSLSPFMVVAQSLYRVAFDTAGGSSVASIADVPSGATISAPPAPTRQGFVFVGWYKDAKGATAWDFGRDVVTANTTLYAVWKAADGGKEPNAGPGSVGEFGPSVDPDDKGDPPAADPGNKTNSDVDRASKGSPRSALADGTGDGTAALLPLSLVIALAALALCMHRARRRMR